jgi:hypothetical protein
LKTKTRGSDLQVDLTAPSTAGMWQFRGIWVQTIVVRGWAISTQSGNASERVKEQISVDICGSPNE